MSEVKEALKAIEAEVFNVNGTIQQLYNCDCRCLLPEMTANSVELILIDPPYNISRVSHYTNNSADRADYKAKYGKHTIDFGTWDHNDAEILDLDFLLQQAYRLLKPHGTLLCFYDIWKFESLRNAAINAGFKQPRIGCWNKTNPVPINAKLNYLTNAKEFFATFVKVGKPTFNATYDNAEYYVDTETAETFIQPILHGKERLKHPTQKPLALIETLIEKHSNLGDTVLDFFAGTGTTGIASANCGRNAILCENIEEYVQMIRTRYLTEQLPN